MNNDGFLKLLELLGTLALSLAGIVAARRAQLDLLGVFAVAMIAAFGGGTVRDLFLGRHRFFWIQNWLCGVAIFLLSVISVAFLTQIRSRRDKALVFSVTVFDAVGLGLLSVVGSFYSLQMYPNLHFVAVVIGVITGCFGGVTCDLIANKVLTVFRRFRLYALCSLAGCSVYVLFYWLHLPVAISVLLGAAITFSIRILMIRSTPPARRSASLEGHNVSRGD